MAELNVERSLNLLVLVACLSNSLKNEMKEKVIGGKNLTPSFVVNALREDNQYAKLIRRAGYLSIDTMLGEWLLDEVTYEVLTPPTSLQRYNHSKLLRPVLRLSA